MMLTARDDEVPTSCSASSSGPTTTSPSRSARARPRRVSAVLRRRSDRRSPRRPHPRRRLLLDVPRMRAEIAGRAWTSPRPNSGSWPPWPAARPDVHPGHLLDALRGVAFETYERAIDTHVKNLRRKIEPETRRPALRADRLRRGLPIGRRPGRGPSSLGHAGPTPSGGERGDGHGAGRSGKRGRRRGWARGAANRARAARTGQVGCGPRRRVQGADLGACSRSSSSSSPGSSWRPRRHPRATGAGPRDDRARGLVMVLHPRGGTSRDREDPRPAGRGDAAGRGGRLHRPGGPRITASASVDQLTCGF